MTKPHIDSAPGLVWRRRRDYWTATWQCRSDIRKRGFAPSSVPLWRGNDGDLDERSAAYIIAWCQHYQNEMLVWGRGGPPPELGYFDGTLGGLIAAYQSEPQSRYHKIRYVTRKNYDSLCRRIASEHGHEKLEEIKSKTIIQWHEKWTESGHTQAHSLIGMLRTLMKFGRTITDEEDTKHGSHCVRLGMVLHDMKFKGPGIRSEAITAAQAIALRAQAHTKGYPSIALAQAFQFELMLRQRDVIGEWLPLDEPGITDVQRGQWKWLRGLRWNEIDGQWRLKHTTSKKQKNLEVDLRLAPMVMEELQQQFPHALPSVGPIVVCERTGLPWNGHHFRQTWRRLARQVGIPDHVYNMDSRAGGITEATQAGAPLEHIRHAATHSNTSTTERYARGSGPKVENVMKLRTKHRNEKATG